jgi:uncharacterized membrane protein
MRFILDTIKTTVIGGLAFLLPVAIVVMIAIKVWQLMKTLSAPLTRAFGIDGIFGVATADIVTVILILLICFVAGLIARSGVGKRIHAYIDSKLLVLVPQYAFVKSMTPGKHQADLEASLKPVLVRFDDAAQIAFLSELPDSGLATVFIPGSPNPWSGAVMHVERERLEPIEAPFGEVVRRLRMVGQKSSSLFPEDGR